MSKKSFFDLEKQGRHTYDKLLQENERNARITRMDRAHQVLNALKQDIKSRSAKLQDVFIFLDSKQVLYQQLVEQYKQRPSTALATKLTRLKQAIDGLIAKIEDAQPKKIIEDLNSHHKTLQSELARKTDKK